MKKLFFCVLSIPFIGLSQNNNTNNSTKNQDELNPNSLLHFTLSETGINSELSEIGTTFFKDKFLIMSNKKRRHTKTTFNKSLNTYNNNIYCTDVDKELDLSYPLQFSKVLDSKNDEGAMTFSKDENTIYYTQTNGESSNFKLYRASLDVDIQGYWKDITELKITTDDYSVETPFLNHSDNKLYFSSNMPGGYGGYDIYSADITENGTITNIKNLGNNINTSSNEKYTFISSDNKYIYFSSEGHNGYGGYDVFRSSITNNNYTNTVNLGPSLNTKKDEISFILVEPNKGYISINKIGNREDFDVYRFTTEQKEQELTISVVENNLNTKLPNVDVLITDEFGNKITETKTNENGEITIKSIPLTQYKIISNKEGYNTETTIITPSISNSKINEVIALKVKGSEIKPINNNLSIDKIFFDFDKATIKKESQVTLLKAISLLNENPDIRISINAHTDSKGPAKYNQTLSEKRAKSTYDFLVNKGADKSRLTFKGFGESQLLNKCNVCTKAQDQENRRVEFKININ